MTSSPKGYDFYFTDAAQFDYAALFHSHSRELEVLLALLLDDPTESNFAVRNLSVGEIDAVFALRTLDLTLFYQFTNPLVLEVIHISDSTHDID